MRRRKEKPTGHELSGTAQQTAPIPSRIVAWEGGRPAGSEATKKEGAPVGRGMARPNSGRLYPGREGEAPPRANGVLQAASYPALSLQLQTNMADALIGGTARTAKKAKRRKPRKRETVRKLYLRNAYSAGSLDALKTTHAVKTRYAEKTFGGNPRILGGGEQPKATRAAPRRPDSSYFLQQHCCNRRLRCETDCMRRRNGKPTDR